MSGITYRDAEALSGIPASTWRRWVSEGRIDADHTTSPTQIDANQAITLAKRRNSRMRLPKPA